MDIYIPRFFLSDSKDIKVEISKFASSVCFIWLSLPLSLSRISISITRSRRWNKETREDYSGTLFKSNDNYSIDSFVSFIPFVRGGHLIPFTFNFIPSIPRTAVKWDSIDEKEVARGEGYSLRVSPRQRTYELTPSFSRSHC